MARRHLKTVQPPWLASCLLLVLCFATLGHILQWTPAVRAEIADQTTSVKDADASSLVTGDRVDSPAAQTSADGQASPAASEKAGSAADSEPVSQVPSEEATAADAKSQAAPIQPGKKESGEREKSESSGKPESSEAAIFRDIGGGQQVNTAYTTLGGLQPQTAGLLLLSQYSNTALEQLDPTTRQKLATYLGSLSVDQQQNLLYYNALLQSLQATEGTKLKQLLAHVQKLQNPQSSDFTIDTHPVENRPSATTQHESAYQPPPPATPAYPPVSSSGYYHSAGNTITSSGASSSTTSTYRPVSSSSSHSYNSTAGTQYYTSHNGNYGATPNARPVTTTTSQSTYTRPTPIVAASSPDYVTDRRADTGDSYLTADSTLETGEYQPAWQEAGGRRVTHPPSLPGNPSRPAPGNVETAVGAAPPPRPSRAGARAQTYTAAPPGGSQYNADEVAATHHTQTQRPSLQQHQLPYATQQLYSSTPVPSQQQHHPQHYSSRLPQVVPPELQRQQQVSQSLQHRNGAAVPAAAHQAPPPQSQQQLVHHTRPLPPPPSHPAPSLPPVPQEPIYVGRLPQEQMQRLQQLQQHQQHMRAPMEQHHGGPSMQQHYSTEASPPSARQQQQQSPYAPPAAARPPAPSEPEPQQPYHPSLPRAYLTAGRAAATPPPVSHPLPQQPLPPTSSHPRPPPVATPPVPHPRSQQPLPHDSPQSYTAPRPSLPPEARPHQYLGRPAPPPSPTPQQPLSPPVEHQAFALPQEPVYPSTPPPHSSAPRDSHFAAEDLRGAAGSQPFQLPQPFLPDVGQLSLPPLAPLLDPAAGLSALSSVTAPLQQLFAPPGYYAPPSSMRLFRSVPSSSSEASSNHRDSHQPMREAEGVRTPESADSPGAVLLAPLADALRLVTNGLVEPAVAHANEVLRDAHELNARVQQGSVQATQLFNDIAAYRNEHPDSPLSKFFTTLEEAAASLNSNKDDESATTTAPGAEARTPRNLQQHARSGNTRRNIGAAEGGAAGGSADNLRKRATPGALRRRKSLGGGTAAQNVMREEDQADDSGETVVTRSMPEATRSIELDPTGATGVPTQDEADSLPGNAPLFPLLQRGRSPMRGADTESDFLLSDNGVASGTRASPGANGYISSAENPAAGQVRYNLTSKDDPFNLSPSAGSSGAARKPTGAAAAAAAAAMREHDSEAADPRQKPPPEKIGEAVTNVLGATLGAALDFIARHKQDQP